MLAVQRPSMGSSKPPNLEMPFGYSFDTTSNFPYPSPTAPAPGPALLDDNESKFLDNFFDGVSSDHFNYDFLNNAPDGSEFGLTGWDELPPTFMGTTSSFGQQPPPQQLANQGIPGMSFGDLNSQMNPGSQIPQTTSAEVVQAAANLLQNPINGRSQHINDGMFRGQNIPMLQTNGAQNRVPSMGPSRQSYPRPPQHQDDFMRDNFYTDMVFGSQPDQSLRNRSLGQKVDIRWGSDVGFNSPQGFVPPSNQEHISSAERSHMQAIEAAFTIGQAPSSADTTRHPSPVPRKKPSTSSHQRTQSFSKEDEEEEIDSARPRKRRKSKYAEDDDEEESPIATTPLKKRKSSILPSSTMNKKHSVSLSNNSPTSPNSSSHQHKRRKSISAAAAAKASRENLTEEQKRENHIKSEQKRRTLIREGFEDLGELVPGLRGGGFSKSAVLIMAADWLEELIGGNEVLRGRVEELEGR